MQYLTDCSLSSFFISPVTQLEIENEISKLKIDKATGPFSIPVSALKILKVYIKRIIQKKAILFQNQFGFRTNYSTNHAVLTIIDKIQRAIDARDYTCGIFLDLSKAFDTVNHEILIQKLEFYGIRGIANNWFTSYLTDRRQTVTIILHPRKRIYPVEYHKDLFLDRYCLLFILMTFIIAPNFSIFISSLMMQIYFRDIKISTL